MQQRTSSRACGKVASLVAWTLVLVLGVSAIAQKTNPPENPPANPPATPPKTLPERIREGFDNTPTRKVAEPGARDPELQKRFNEIKAAGIQLPEAKYIGDLPPDIRGMFPRTKWNQPLPQMIEDPRRPGTYVLRDTPIQILGGAPLPQLGLNGAGWMDWWEGNRERYWPNRRGAPAREIPEVSTKVSHSLELAAASRDPAVRAQAALTLATIKHPKALEILDKLTADSSDAVAIHAWAGIGLLNTPATLEYLESLPKGQRNAIGWVLAVGLAEKPTEAMWNAMPRCVDEARAPEAQRLALWALRRHLPPGARATYLRALDFVSNPYHLNEILRGLAKLNEPEDISNLVFLSQGNVRAVTWDRFAQQRVRPGTFEAIWIAQDRRNAQPLRPGRRAVGDPDAPPPDTSYPYRFALEALAEMESPNHQAMAVLRHDFLGTEEAIDEQAARIMDPNHTRQPGVRTSIGGFRGGTGSPAVLLALGRLATGDDVAIAKAILTGPTAKNEQNLDADHPALDAPSYRGFAALSQGLYLHRGGLQNEHAGNASPVNGKVIPSAAEDLFEFYRMEGEARDVRAACVLALGLSGEPTFSVRIKEGMKSLKPGHEVIWGFSILALGMLGDPEAVELASRHIGPRQDSIDVAGLLARGGRERIPAKELIARRAAVDGLAALGDARALPYLYGEWGKDPFLDMEVARAIARCLRLTRESPPGVDHPYVDAMMRLAVQDRNPELAASAAMSLGMLYENGQRALLGELIAGAAKSIGARRLAGGRLDFSSAVTEPVMLLGNPFYYLVLRPTRPPEVLLK